MGEDWYDVPEDNPLSPDWVEIPDATIIEEARRLRADYNYYWERRRAWEGNPEAGTGTKGKTDADVKGKTAASGVVPTEARGDDRARDE